MSFKIKFDRVLLSMRYFWKKLLIEKCIFIGKEEFDY